MVDISAKVTKDKMFSQKAFPGKGKSPATCPSCHLFLKPQNGYPVKFIYLSVLMIPPAVTLK
jgi:hypothetical protein